MVGLAYGCWSKLFSPASFLTRRLLWFQLCRDIYLVVNVLVQTYPLSEVSLLAHNHTANYNYLSQLLVLGTRSFIADQLPHTWPWLLLVYSFCWMTPQFNAAVLSLCIKQWLATSRRLLKSRWEHEQQYVLNSHHHLLRLVSEAFRTPRIWGFVCHGAKNYALLTPWILLNDCSVDAMVIPHCIGQWLVAFSSELCPLWYIPP